MNRIEFKSQFHPEMNEFLFLLQEALDRLPNNPKPQCKGFYLCDYDASSDALTVERIGDVPIEKYKKYFKFAMKKVTQTLEFGAVRSKEFENDKLEQYPGGVSFANGATGISGHESMIDEAGSILWRIHKINAITRDLNYWITFPDRVNNMNDSIAPDNKWVMILANLIRGASRNRR